MIMTTPFQSAMAKLTATEIDHLPATYPVEITAAEAAAIRERLAWRPIETAPKDGTPFLVYCPPAHGLPEMQSLCAWHPDAGFCVDELREPRHWQPLPEPPND